MEIVVSQWRAAGVIVADILDIFCGERGEGESCVQVIFCVQVILAGSKVGKLFFIDRRGQENHV